LVLAASLCLHADDITAAPQPHERTISFYHIHTHERLTITYKRNGHYIPEALEKINWIMRDWRKNKVKAIDPRTIDLAWEMHEELDSKEPINIICGYRTPSTNEMLRHTRGGQARQSQHITGKAIDITFPDVPLRKMRYSALVHEVGGVGYYPTSGIPFVHIDSARVRMWPRMPRNELALLFPKGHTKYVPIGGRPITPADVKAARREDPKLAVQVAQFFRDRQIPGQAQTMVASNSKPSSSKSPMVVASLEENKSEPKQSLRHRVSLTSELDAPASEVKPFASAKVGSIADDSDAAAIVSKPRLVERPSHFTKGPSPADRSKFESLVAAAAALPPPKLISGPKPAVRPQNGLAAAALAEKGRRAPRRTAEVASLDPAAAAGSISDMNPDSPGSSWVEAPAFDEDHPEELAYHPFPLAPLMSASADTRDQPLADLQHPDVAATLATLDDFGGVAPMKFRPGRQLAEEMWAEQFQGKAVHLEALQEIEKNRLPAGMENRTVRTSSR
jgi:uncharacterized protein YcbK (DUF882 family)